MSLIQYNAQHINVRLTLQQCNIVENGYCPYNNSKFNAYYNVAKKDMVIFTFQTPLAKKECYVSFTFRHKNDIKITITFYQPKGIHKILRFDVSSKHKGLDSHYNGNRRLVHKCNILFYVKQWELIILIIVLLH